MPVPSKKSYTFPDGEEIELFYIGTLANCLGRESKTIRKWEISGVIPPALFRDEHNNRMYSKEQIDLIVKIAEKTKISQGSSYATFSNRVHKQLNVLIDNYIERMEINKNGEEEIELEKESIG